MRMKKNLFLRLALVGLLAGSSVMAGEHRLPNQPVGKDGYYIVKWDCEKNTWAESNDMEYDETFVLAIDLTGTPYESWVKNAQTRNGVTYPVDNTLVSLNTFRNDRGTEYVDQRARLWHIRDNIYGAMYNFGQFVLKNGNNNAPAIGEKTKIYTRIFESATLFSDRCYPIEPSGDHKKGSVWDYKDEWYSAKDNEPFFVFAPYTGTKTGAEFTTEEQTPGTFIFYDNDHYVVSKGYSAPCSVNDDQCCPFFFPLDPKTQTVPVGKDTILVAKEKSGNLTGVKYQWYYYETSKGESTAVKYTGTGGTSKTCHPNTSVDGSDYTYYCFITTDNCPDGVYTTQAQVIVQNPCPKYTWTIDGVEGLDTPLYPGGYFDITCTCEAGAPTVNVTGNNIQVGTQTTSGNKVSFRLTVLGTAQKTDKITFKATHEATTAFKSCDDIHEIPVGNCENGLAYTMQGFNGNGKYVIDHNGKVEMGTASNKNNMWQPIPTGEKVNGYDVYYLKNLGTGQFLYRGSVQMTGGSKGNLQPGDYDYAEPLTSAVNGMTDDYKWFFYRTGDQNRRIYVVCKGGWTGSLDPSFSLHNRNWSYWFCDGGNNQMCDLRVCSPEMKVGKMVGYSGSNEMFMENDPYNQGNWQFKEVFEAPEHIQTTIGWNGTAPVSPVELSAGGTCTYTGKRTDAIHSINQTFTYTSSDPSIATVDATTGTVKAVSGGTVTITAKLEDVGCFDGDTITYQVKVKGCPDFVWAIDGTEGLETKMYPGGWYMVSCTTEDGAPDITVTGTGVTTETATKKDNTTTMKVILSGTATGDMAFKATIKPGGLDCKDEQPVAVSACPDTHFTTTVDWNGSAPEAKVEASMGDEMTYAIKRTDDVHSINAAITYTSSNEEVATVDENGKVAVVGPGTTTITATLEDVGCFDGAEKTYDIHVKGCPEFTWMTDGTAADWEKDKMYPGGWYLVSCTTEEGAPDITVSGTGIIQEAVSKTGNTTTIKVILTGEAQPNTDITFTASLTTTAGLSCSDVQKLTISECTASGVESRKIEWFNYNKPGNEFPEYWIHGGAPVFLRDNEGVLEADIEHSDGLDQWYIIPTGEKIAGQNVFYMQNVKTLKYVYRGSQHGQIGGSWEYAEALLNSTLPTSDAAKKDYKWVLFAHGNDTAVVCANGFAGTDAELGTTAYMLHVRNWEAAGLFSNPNIPKPRMVCGKTDNQLGSPVFYFKGYTITKPVISFATEVEWDGTTPADTIDVTKGETYTYTIKRTDDLHSINEKITYSSDNTSFATVDPTTGQVTIIGDKGEATITASLEGVGCFDGVELSYVVRIITECPNYSWYLDGEKITELNPAVMYAGGWYNLSCKTDAGAPTTFTVTGNGIETEEPTTVGDMTTIKVTLLGTATGELKLYAENPVTGAYILCPDSLLFNISDCPATTPAELMTTAAWVGTAPEAIIYANPAATYTYTIERTDAIHSINKAIHYESTNTTVATVDATTGVVTVNEEESGETTIMAILEDAGCFKGDTLSYVIKMKECPEVTWAIDGQAGLTKPLYAGGWYEISATAVTGAPTLTITGTDVVAETPTTSGNTTTVKITLLGTATGDITMQAANAEAETYKACTDEQIVAMASCAAATEAEIQTALSWVGQTPDAVITTKKGATYTYAAERSDELHSINKTITYTSSDETVATVDANGHVQVIAELGEATITVELEEVGCFKSAVLTYIIKAHPDYLTFDDNNGTGVWSDPLNWWPDYNRLPNETDSATIAAPCQVDITSARTYYLTFTVADGYDITVLPTGALTIVGKLTNAAEGDILIQSNENGTGTFVMSELNTNVPAEVQFYCRAFDGDKEKPTWQYIGMPLKDNTKPATWYTAANAQYYTWGDTPNMVVGGNWEERTGNATYSLPQFNGICLTQQEKTTYTYKGLLCDPQSRNVGLPLNNQGEYPMFCFVANSWTAPIRIADLENSDFEDADATVYIMNTGTFKEARNQQGNESLTGQAKLNGQYNVIPVHAAPYLSDALQVIPSMQGFFVRRQGQVNTTSPTNLSLDYKKLIYDVNYNLSTESARAPRRAAAEDGIRTLHLMVENAYWADAVDMLEGEAFTEGFDQGWDGRKMQGHDTKVSLSVQTVDGNMAVAALNDWENVPLAFKGMKGLPYTFTISNVDATDLYLYDQLTDTYTALQNGATYSFEAGKSEENDRFYIRRIAAKQGSQNSEEVVPSIDGKYIIHGHLMIVNDGVWYNAVGTKMHNLQ